MSAKLMLSLDGADLDEYRLNKQRMTIGRKARNDIVLDHPAISNEHAAIITIIDDSFLEDLDSAHGLSVNGVATKKHHLQHNDVIEIGKYKLTYLNPPAPLATSEGLEKTSPPNGVEKTAANQGNAVPQPDAGPSQHPALVQILNGANAGKQLELVKSLTTLGKPGVQVAVLARRPQGFFITHAEGIKFPLVNDESIGENPHPLHDHDIIELSGVKMEFRFK